MSNDSIPIGIANATGDMNATYFMGDTFVQRTERIMQSVLHHCRQCAPWITLLKPLFGTLVIMLAVTGVLLFLGLAMLMLFRSSKG